jgi:hypothetical protein
MAKAIPNPEAPQNGSLRKQLLQQGPEDRTLWTGPATPGTPHLANLDFWTAHDSPGSPATVDPVELEHFRQENARFRTIIADLRMSLEDAQSKGNQATADRQKEYESLLEEKSELIRSLHLKIQELQDQKPVAPQTPKEEELLALSEELERERCQLQQECKQLEEERNQFMEDEESMTKQMRDMEVQMARERADFSRQRSELNRVYEEIRREMDNIERNGLLNQRLSQLRQRFQDVVNPQGPTASPRSASGAGFSAASKADSSATDASAPKRKESFLGRLFG